MDENTSVSIVATSIAFCILALAMSIGGCTERTECRGALVKQERSAEDITKICGTR